MDTKIISIHFEDKGQDFLVWDIDTASGIVVDCRPFQARIWNGTKVYKYAKGKCPIISMVLTDKNNKQVLSKNKVTLNYKVTKIETK